MASSKNLKLRADRPVERPLPMTKERTLAWLVEFAHVDAGALARGRPGDLPNLIYELRQWLDLAPDEPLSKEVRVLENDLVRLQQIVARVAELVSAVADRKRFEAQYGGGRVILEAGKLMAEGGRALSYQDANLEDAVTRVALDDLYENAQGAARIRRCQEPDCRSVFLAQRANQLYCSHRCANKMASRTYRQSHGKQRAARARERYERLVKQRTAPNVKVARRPRQP
ncbi:MAG TPA: CGNR zinc finger domain-containing protein [Candidatus Binataceae bacterium]|nr:CGNR zinc finger domain-containing protein [Candidatus Binataceae bacterium]